MKPAMDLVREWREDHPEYIFRSEHHMRGWHQGRKECVEKLEAWARAWDDAAQKQSWKRCQLGSELVRERLLGVPPKENRT